MKITSRKPPVKPVEPPATEPLPDDGFPELELPEVKELDEDPQFYHEDWVIQGSHQQLTPKVL